jgi:hypothetical protein
LKRKQERKGRIQKAGTNIDKGKGTKCRSMFSRSTDRAARQQAGLWRSQRDDGRGRSR